MGCVDRRGDVPILFSSIVDCVHEISDLHLSYSGGMSKNEDLSGVFGLDRWGDAQRTPKSCLGRNGS
jgi:hypothetical protein